MRRSSSPYFLLELRTGIIHFARLGTHVRRFLSGRAETTSPMVGSRRASIPSCTMCNFNSVHSSRWCNVMLLVQNEMHQMHAGESKWGAM